MNKEEKARKIWKTCFQDTEEEINFYFTKHFQEAQWKYREKEGSILSSLHANPYSIKIRDSVSSSPYLVGVATLPEHRGQGHMTKLLFEEMLQLRKQGDDFCFLLPINPMIYRGFGFEYFSGMEEYTFDISLLTSFPKDSSIKIVELTRENLKEYWEDWKKIYSIAMLPYSFHEVRDFDSFENLLEETELSQGRIYLFYQNTRPAAYLMMHMEENDIRIRELLGTNHEAYSAMFYFLKSFQEYYSQIHISSPENSHLEFFLENQCKVEKKFSPYVMGRILNVKKFLQKYQISAPEITIFVEDPVLFENTGYYTLSSDISFTQNQVEDYDFQIGVRELVPLLLGFFDIQDLLRLGKIKLHSVEHLEELKKIFHKKFNYFHQYW
ncbi:acetyltransferase [Fusobacterium necrophorum BFTR-1]|uniref:GNAT family N-acetyltransferase n=1 Tax=Fusobacterium necrophorum TaxID=859 RepID=UPI000460C54A|nr:GNAT family N-acetyltransferase [Fusobacterium necrophorum]KDE63504.1 acetyltransferase [Fusobacterium necrophorum BFTR-1]